MNGVGGGFSPRVGCEMKGWVNKLSKWEEGGAQNLTLAKGDLNGN